MQFINCTAFIIAKMHEWIDFVIFVLLRAIIKTGIMMTMMWMIMGCVMTAISLMYILLGVIIIPIFHTDTECRVDAILYCILFNIYRIH